ncbi:MAG: hypothetical protein WC196_00125 [Bacilli bacterium]|nr:hypothetical protein [Bacilli bacterium]MDD4065362.1 hypothetical protein [Bacilli bacterium]
MKQLNVIDQGHTYGIIVNHYKYIIGRNYQLKHKIKTLIRQYMEKVSYSEYEDECMQRIGMNIDDSRIDTKGWFFFTITSEYDPTYDCKLGSKSLILKYLESQLQNIEFDDEFSTVKLSLDVFSHSQLANLLNIQVNQMGLEAYITEFNQKMLLKMLECTLLKDDLSINNHNISYEENVLLQMELVKRIALSVNDKQILVIIDIPLLTDKIKESIESIQLDKLLIIALIDFYPKNMDYHSCSICNNDYYDFIDEIHNEELLEHLPYVIEITELHDLYNKIINNEVTEKTQILLNYI